MTATALQNATHGLAIGVPVSIDLKSYMSTPGATFSIVGTSRAYNQTVLLGGLSLSANGILSGTPTEQGTVLIRVRSALGTRSPDTSWTARSAGAYNSQRFDTATPINLGTATGRAFRCSFDTAKKRSGAGSLYMFSQPGSTNQEGKWQFSLKVPQDYDGVLNGGFPKVGGFLPGEDFYLQFALYTDRNYVQYPWAHYGKIAILDGLPWTGNLNLGPTANPWESVLIPGDGVMYGYTNGNEGVAWNFSVGGRPLPTHVNSAGHDVLQSAVLDTSRSLNGDSPGLPTNASATWSSAQQERARNGHIQELALSAGFPDGRPDPLTAANPFPIDGWCTVLLRMKLANAPIQNDGNGYNFLTTGGVHQVWVAQDGQDYQLLFNDQNHWLRITQGMTAPNYFNRSSAPFDEPHTDAFGGNAKTQTYQGVTFTNLFFNVAMPASPTHQMWIDEIICSPNPIPAPDFDGTGNYRTADALVTIKVGPAPASALATLAAGMAPGTWSALTTNNLTDMTLPNFLGDRSSPFIEFTDKAVWNPSTKKFLVQGCARGNAGNPNGAYDCATSESSDAGYVSYDETTNTWTRLTGSPVDTAAHAYNHAAMNRTNGDYYYVTSAEGNSPKLWKLSGGVYTQLSYPPSFGSPAVALEWFPERNVLTMFDGGNGFPARLCSLSGGSWTSTNLSGNPLMGVQVFSRYSKPRALLYFGGGNQLGAPANSGKMVFTQDASGTITRRADCPIALGIGGGGGRLVVDPVTGNLLTFSSGTPGTGHTYEYNPTTNVWTDRGTHPLGDVNGQLIAVFTDVPAAGVIMVMHYSPEKVWLYRNTAGVGS